MKREKPRKSRNPVARSPILAKGHAHQPKTRPKRSKVKARLKKNPEAFSMRLADGLIENASTPPR
ncbi:hypothetical protein [Thioalkalivibrio sp. ALE19]|uniref:hypothetical protein n=1 Tax=Thioalkalivibrio sp. ALE19 TaxID=1266909 RepID=UPI0012DEC52C|nr:hypothetical protein [Thioalkalivibrio sp. ALE19]